MRRITIANIRIFRNIRSLAAFLRTFRINPLYFAIAVVMSLGAAFFDFWERSRRNTGTVVALQGEFVFSAVAVGFLAYLGQGGRFQGRPARGIASVLLRERPLCASKHPDCGATPHSRTCRICHQHLWVVQNMGGTKQHGLGSIGRTDRFFQVPVRPPSCVVRIS